jgi:hypothetical protein
MPLWTPATWLNTNVEANTVTIGGTAAQKTPATDCR